MIGVPSGHCISDQAFGTGTTEHDKRPADAEKQQRQQKVLVLPEPRLGGVLR
jgi:hypothetical protein